MRILDYGKGNIEAQEILEEWYGEHGDPYRLAYYISDDGDDLCLEYYSDLWEEWITLDPNDTSLNQVHFDDMPIFNESAATDNVIDMIDQTDKENKFSLTLNGHMNIIVGLEEGGPMEIRVNGKEECAEVMSAILKVMGTSFDVSAYTDKEGKILSSILTKKYD
jgi:hypothetical protein